MQLCCFEQAMVELQVSILTRPERRMQRAIFWLSVLAIVVSILTRPERRMQRRKSLCQQ